MKHIYAFGSICRGEIDSHSDADILVVCNDPKDYSIEYGGFSVYAHNRIAELWEDGNPFAWHLHLESQLLFSSDGNNFLKNLGRPRPYKDGATDCERFFNLFCDSISSLKESNKSTVFDLSAIFLATRNLATCYSLTFQPKPTFSRHAALLLAGNSLSIDKKAYNVLERSRLLSTRGFGETPTEKEVFSVMDECDKIHKWMCRILEDICYEESIN